MTKWTNAQLDAINARNSNILVNAAAGSGKTAVLVERVIKMITEDGVPIDKLLIVTFTKAAAAQMRKRIGDALRELIRKNPNDTNAKRQLSMLPGANISTIDSFCINLVRENFFNLDIEQDFRTMDEPERVICEQSVLDELLEEYYQQGDKEFLSLVEMFSSGKDDKNFVNTVLKLNSYITSQAFPYKWLDDACQLYNPDIDINDSVIGKYVFEQTKRVCDYALKLIDNSRDALVEGEKIYDKLVNMLDGDEEIFQRVYKSAENKKWDEISRYIYPKMFSRLPSVRNEESVAKPIVANYRDSYKKLLAAQLCPLYCADSEEYKHDCAIIYPLIKLLVDIVKQFNMRVLEEKKSLNAYTFSDIEHFAINLLFSIDDDGIVEKTELAKEMSNNFEQILVDEYQDTNSAQDRLFAELSNGRNRFMVGDMKQSIYRFRLAMPQIFNEKKDKYLPYDKAGTGSRYKINLDTNFRSRQGICDYVNFVFSHIMSREVGEVSYDENERLNCGCKYNDSYIPCAQLKLVETPEDEDKDEYESRQIGKYILDKVKSGESVKDGDAYRKIRFSDFAVLLRTAKNRMPVIVKVFNEMGIPVVANNKVNLFENNEVVILLNLLKTIDNPISDISLLATLMSVFYGYSPDALAKAKIDYPSKNLYSSISKSPDFSRVIDDLKRYREYASSMSVENLIRQIIGETSYLSVISAMGNHEQRVMNVMKFIDIAKQFDNGENVGLTAFLRYINAVKDGGYNIDCASAESSVNAVNIMTIHQSKGLEFPVCILAFSSHEYNTNDLKAQIQYNSKYALGLKVYNDGMMYRYDTVQYNALKNINKYEMISENLRVLYVAITRAKEQFVTFYSDKNIKSAVKSIGKKIVNSNISPFSVLDIIKDGDFILLTSLLHKDGGILREMCENEIDTDLNYDFDMSIDVISQDNIDTQQEEKTDEEFSYNDNLLNEIKDKLSFTYDRLSLKDYASKRTASSLDNAEQNYKYITSSKPAFLSKDKMTSAQKGTAMHSFMQYCDYAKSQNNLEAEIDRLKQNNYITEDEAQVLDRSKLAALFNSSLAKRMFGSDNIYREIKVSSFVAVNQIEDTDFDDEVFIQGIADCVFEENGELVLVDYKTDKVDSEEELLERYKNQISFYKYAVAKTLKKPVKEALLYSFYLNKECIYK